VHDDEQPKSRAQAEQDVSVFVIDMVRYSIVRILDQEALLVCEDRGCLFERHAEFPLVGHALSVIPLEARFGHVVSVTTM